MTEQWQELRETITELRDNNGTGTQQEVCKFLANLMDILEKQMQEPCEDAISREDLEECKELMTDVNGDTVYAVKMSDIRQLHSVTQKLGHCKDCKYFEYDSVAKVDGIPLIVAHEICSRWGDGCKTKEDGYCFLFGPQESEDEE